jgi:hypothetical protein
MNTQHPRWEQFPLTCRQRLLQALVEVGLKQLPVRQGTAMTLHPKSLASHLARHVYVYIASPRCARCSMPPRVKSGSMGWWSALGH